MSHKRCSQCGRFMSIDDLLPDDDEFDFELAIECGFNEEIDSRFDERWSRFVYIQDGWHCRTCGISETDSDGKRYYFNPDTGWYDGEKPMTPQELIVIENQKQEAAGQLRLFD